MAIATLAEIKTLLQITDTTKDELITMLIPEVESDLLEFMNNTFDGVYPEWLKPYLADMINYRIQKRSGGIASESIARYSVSYKSSQDFIAGYPAEIMKGLYKKRKLKWQ
jgi:NADPH-dependent 7-cyano-7-deazaguanine reductase QueF